jgi:hypothetical protein
MSTQSHTGSSATSGFNVGDRLVGLLRILMVLAFAASATYYVYSSRHWELTIDSPIMHYVNFLMDHGLKPYSDITDNNMPGAYFTESWAMHVFGAGDLGWRLYEFFLLTVLTGAMVVIAKPYDWMAGVFAGGLFVVVHAAEGPEFAVERELVILVLLAVAYAAVFTASRRRWPALMLLAGFSSGLAASIKPTFLPLPVALFALLAWVLWRKKISPLLYLAWALLGLVVAAALDVRFLLHYQALDGFVFIMRKVLPAYGSLQRMGTGHLISLMLPKGFLWLVLLIVGAGATRWGKRAAWTWEQWAIAAGVAFGVLSYFVQGKGFEHHRYTYLAFLFLLLGMELMAALKQRGAPKMLGVAAMLLLLIWVIPYYGRETHRRGPGQAVIANAMEVDLQTLGGAQALQQKVQCFDLVYGCLNALYHLQIVENTGFTGDLLFFNKKEDGAVKYYRDLYWKLETQNPATVIVLSNEVLLQPNNFGKIYGYPRWADYLAKNFTQIDERTFPPNGNAYRIYIRNGTPLLAKAEALNAEGKL